jgi:hypothetical protein
MVHKAVLWEDVDWINLDQRWAYVNMMIIPLLSIRSREFFEYLKQLLGSVDLFNSVICICGSFRDVVSSSCYVTLNGTMMSE